MIRDDTATVFNKVKTGEMTLAQFEEWVYQECSDAHESGNESGFHRGYEEGRQEGYDEGYDAGYESGCDNDRS